MKSEINWQALHNNYQSIAKQSLNDLFDVNPNRGEIYSIEQSGIYFDYSKNPLTQNSIDLLIKSAGDITLKEKIKALYRGDTVNQSEQRAALHTSLRDPNNINGIDKRTHETICQGQQCMFEIARKITSGELKSYKDKPFKHLVCLGIGGSYLGPKFVIDALAPTVQKNISIHFIANLDPNALYQTLRKLDITDCLFFIASKSFSTFETLVNAKAIKKQLVDLGLNDKQIQKHFVAATSNTHAAVEFGCHKNNILELWGFIGGRYSLWSSIGLPIVIAFGENAFSDLLKGAHEMDQHFLNAPLKSNMPFLLGAIAIWFQNIMGLRSRAIIPYDHNLKTFPAFLQQLEMESLGKNVDQQNAFLSKPSGAIIWGSEGTNSQHAFHQLLHQSDLVIPCDFIVCKRNQYNQTQQEMLISQCLAQSRALMIGQKSKNTYQTLIGNKPSNTLILESLTSKNLGALIALYEHKVFVQASFLNVNPFDQWGVEFGKKTGQEMNEAMSRQNQGNQQEAIDSSSKALLRFLTA